VAPIRKLNATTFIRRSPCRRSASAWGSAPANDSAKDAGLVCAPDGRLPGSVSAVGGRCGSARCLGPGVGPPAQSDCHPTIIRYRRGCSVTTPVAGPAQDRPVFRGNSYRPRTQRCCLRSRREILKI